MTKQRSALSLSDEWETPKDVYDQLCYGYGVFPELDVSATKENKKCEMWLSEKDDSLKKEWTKYGTTSIVNVVDVWCNPPHSKTEAFVRKAIREWKKYNMNIMMIIPANSICTKYAEQCIEPHAEYHPIFFRPKFLRDGVPSKDPARNAYFVVIWRRRE